MSISKITPEPTAATPERPTSYRFLLSRRWLGLLLAVLVVSSACYELGRWQFHRYAERHDSNAVTRANLAAAPAPLDDVMSTDAPPSSTDEWRRVEVTGSYDADRQLAVLYRTRSGAPGIDIVTPLVTSSGAAVLVDRGWQQTAGNGNQVNDLPAPPGSTVTVTGWVRLNSSDSGNRVAPSDGSVRSISSIAIAPTLPYPLYQGFLDLTGESQTVKPSPARADPPDLSGGPSFFYGVQWWFFALLAIGFWVYFAYAERNGTKRRADTADPEVTDRE
ncbi:MAG: SURF1 family protein [Nocardioidaceae bacterium]